MKGIIKLNYAVFCCLLFSVVVACKSDSGQPSGETISSLNLKRGALVACGSPDKKFGSVGFISSCDPLLKKDFELGVALLHSFEYDESEKVFATIIDKQPSCAMAYWGVAMSNFHTLWAPPTDAELQKGAKAIAIANSISEKTERESAFINAIASYYSDYDKTDHRSRCLQFEKSMEKLQAKYP